jgi:hypothetical protein
MSLRLLEGTSVDSALSLRAALTAVAELNDAGFLDLERSIVQRYRVRPQDQEWIATELLRRRRQARNPHELDRLEEILAMLEHVHDPLISGSALN